MTYAQRASNRFVTLFALTVSSHCNVQLLDEESVKLSTAVLLGVQPYTQHRIYSNERQQQTRMTGKFRVAATKDDTDANVVNYIASLWTSHPP
jgi:hypothetical protein